MLARLKFEISGLVKEMLDQVDQSVFQSSDSTFLDPAMGGGQFIFETIKRLKEQGHSYDSIKTRVFGFESNIVYVNYVKERYLREFGEEIPATLRVGGLEELESLKMRFDLVMGNPPYQHQSDSKGNKMWYRFVKKMSECVLQDGYLVMITPTSWVKGGSNVGKWGMLKTLFAEKQLVVASMDGVNSHFPGIGVEIGWWVMKNTDNNQPSKFLLSDGIFESRLSENTILSTNGRISNGIVQKVLIEREDKFTIHSFDNKGVTKDESDKPTVEFQYPHWVMGSDKTNDLCIRYKKSLLRHNLTCKKIVFPISNRYWNPYYDDQGMGVMSQGFVVVLSDSDTKEGSYSVFYSKLFKYLCFNLQIAKNGFMKTNMVRALPKLDLSCTWTDSELYEHFGLTEEEIRYIEEQVK
jgi:site-specific DNA-methyltransferase (adenine-specific)